MYGVTCYTSVREQLPSMKPVDLDVEKGYLDTTSHDTSMINPDDVFIMTTDMIEDRIQVQRRMLEQMMLASALCEGSTYHNCSQAELFFKYIMQSFNVDVTWPTRLKIGAKTKKDPHVKIRGLPKNVEEAKNKILEVMEVKQNRITLKVDVPFNEHSHIIGRQGRNTQNVMRKTGCHIHFPDSNRDPSMSKSNQVTIAGPMATIEQARFEIRSLAPLNLSFSLANYNGPIPVHQIEQDEFVLRLADRVGLMIAIRDLNHDGIPFLQVKASAHQERNVISVVNELSHWLFGSPTDVSLSIDILPQQQQRVIGVDGCHINIISRLTNASIHYPRPERGYNYSAFIIRGPVESVCMARRYLMGILPLQMQFDVHSLSQLPPGLDIQSLEREFELSICMKPKTRSTYGTPTPSSDTSESDAHVVTVKGMEYQASDIYSMRCRFGIMDRQRPPTCTQYEFMNRFTEMIHSSTSPIGSLYSDISTPVIVSPAVASPVFSMGSYFAVPSPTPTIFNQTVHINSPTPTTIVSDVNNIPISVELSFNHSQVENGQRGPPPSYSSATQRSSSRSIGVVEDDYSPSNYLQPPSIHAYPVLRSSGQGVKSARYPSSGYASAITDNIGGGISSRSSSISCDSSKTSQPDSRTHSISPTERLVVTDEVTTPQVSIKIGGMGVRVVSPNQTPATNSGYAIKSTTTAPNPESNPLASGILQSAVNMANENEYIFFYHFGETLEQKLKFRPRWKIVGAERQVLMSEYQEKAVEATKAMCQQPNGEPRAPNNKFSGLGFSRSMPAQYLREEKLTNKISEKFCVVSTILEDDEEDRIGPWPLEQPKLPQKSMKKLPDFKNKCASKQTSSFMSCSTYFDGGMMQNGANRSLNSINQPQYFDIDNDDVTVLLSKLHLSQFEDRFREEQVDLSMLLTLSEQDFKEMEINTFGARRKLFCAVKKINQALSQGVTKVQIT